MAILINKRFLTIVWTIAVILSGCGVFRLPEKKDGFHLPAAYGTRTDTANIAQVNWRNYYNDPYLIALIDTALKYNQELQIVMQEIEIAKNEARARKGEYLPFIGAGGGTGLEKPGRYSRFGAVEESLEIKPGQPFPEPLPEYAFGLQAGWELDIWKKLRNARKAAVLRYMGTVEGKNFMITRLVAEIAEAYYELMALDNLLEVLDRNIEIQTMALRVVEQQKDAARVTQLAVNRFQAQLLNTQNLRFEVKQRITETENRIRFLTGRHSENIPRNSDQFFVYSVDSVMAGVPSQLLLNRADIRQAEKNLAAARVDVKVARASFLPRVGIRAGLGFQAFNAAYLLNPESLTYNLFGELVAPLVNRNALVAGLRSANARQIQAAWQYEQTILNAYTQVLNQLAKAQNYTASFHTKAREVEILNQSVGIAANLFNSARADYAEVLLTQREALEARKDLIDIKLRQLQAKVGLYRALGGGWR